MLSRSFKNTVFSEKVVEDRLGEDMAVLRRRGRLVTKINITFFVGNEVLNIFIEQFFQPKKKTYFPKYLQKIIFGGHEFLWQSRSRTTKMS